MAVKTWKLVDVDAGVYVNSLVITPEDVEGEATGYRIEKRRLCGGPQEGVDLVLIDNGTFSFAVLLTRGMGVWFAERDGVRFGWRSPVAQPVHPAFVPLYDPSGIGWLDGFNEMLVRCGLESNGAPEFDDRGKLLYPLHGKIANLPARQVEVTVDGETGGITLRGVVHESRLFCAKLALETVYTTQVGQTGFVVQDSVTNLSAQPGAFQLLYHLNFGPPLLDEGGKVMVPLERLAPRDALAASEIARWETIDPPTTGSTEVCYLCQPASDAEGDTLALLRNSDYHLGVTVGYNVKELPCFTVWKSRQAVEDGYVAGLEPATNYPNVHSFEKRHGRVVDLGPGESKTMRLALAFLTQCDAIHAAEQAIAEIQKSAQPRILNAPLPEWSTG